MGGIRQARRDYSPVHGVAGHSPNSGNGILTSEEPEHKRNRSLVQSAFSPRRIATYGDQMVAATQRLSSQWRDRVRTGDTGILVSEQMSDLTLDIVGRTLFGADLTGDAVEISEALTAVLGRFSRMLSPLELSCCDSRLPTRRRLIESVERLDAVVARLIAQKQAQLRWRRSNRHVGCSHSSPGPGKWPGP